MANWCYSKVVFMGEKEKLDRVNADYTAYLDENNTAYGCTKAGEWGGNSSWVGYYLRFLLNNVGVKEAKYTYKSYDNTENFEKFTLGLCEDNIPCFIQDIDDVELNDGSDAILFSFEEKWSSREGVYKAIAMYYGLEYMYTSEEPGCEFYINTDINDTFFGDTMVANNTSDNDEDYPWEMYGRDTRDLLDTMMWELGKDCDYTPHIQKVLDTINDCNEHVEFNADYLNEALSDDIEYSFCEYAAEFSYYTDKEFKILNDINDKYFKSKVIKPCKKKKRKFRCRFKEVI